MTRGKKILTVIVCIFLIVGVGVYFLLGKLSDIKNELDAHIEPMILEMSIAGWSQESLNKYASPALQSWFAQNNVDQGIPLFKSLGKLTQYNGVQQFNMVNDSAEILASAQFEHGVAHITLNLSKQSNEWVVDSLNINSPVFLQ